MHELLSPAIAALAERRLDDAWKHARTVLDLDPQEPFALMLASVALRLLGRQSTAELFRKRAASAPLPHFPTAEDIEFMRRLDELAATGAGNDASARARRLANEGAYWFRFENVERAERCFKEALEADPVCCQAYYYRGLMAAELGRDAIARLCFAKALQADPDCAGAKMALERLVSGKAPTSSLTA